MKKITNLAAIVVAVFIFAFTSCTPDPDAPSISVTMETTGEILQGQKVVFSITASADTEAESSLLKIDINKVGTIIDGNSNFKNATVEGSMFDFNDGVTDASFKFEYTIPAGATVGDLELTFTVQDSEGLMMDNKQTITVFAAKPTITVTKTSTEVTAPGVAVVYEVVVASASSATLKNIVVVAKNAADETITGATGTGVNNIADNGIFETGTENFLADTKTTTFKYTYVSPSYALGTDVTLTFTVTNSDDYTEVAEETISVIATPITEFTGKTLNYDSNSLDVLSQFSTVSGPVTSFAVTAKPDEAVSDFAFVYRYINNGTEKEYSIVSPNADLLTSLYNHTIGGHVNLGYDSNTATKLEKSSKTFDKITPEYLQTLTVGANSEIKGIADGDILVFETSTGKKGALKVTTVTETKATATITIDVKVQQ